MPLAPVSYTHLDVYKRQAWLSPELTLAEIERIAPQRGEMTLGLMVLGAPRVMTSEHCILQVAGACIHDCANCRLRARDFKLKNIDGRMLPVRTGLNGRSHLYDGVQLDATPQIPQLLRAGVTPVSYTHLERLPRAAR